LDESNTSGDTKKEIMRLKKDLQMMDCRACRSCSVLVTIPRL
jgi:hypothetical protein